MATPTSWIRTKAGVVLGIAAAVALTVGAGVAMTLDLQRSWAPGVQAREASARQVRRRGVVRMESVTPPQEAPQLRVGGAAPASQTLPALAGEPAPAGTPGS